MPPKKASTKKTPESKATPKPTGDEVYNASAIVMIKQSSGGVLLVKLAEKADPKSKIIKGIRLDHSGQDKTHFKYEEGVNTTFKYADIVKEVTDDVKSGQAKKGKKSITIYTVTTEFAENEKLFEADKKKNDDEIEEEKSVKDKSGSDEECDNEVDDEKENEDEDDEEDSALKKKAPKKVISAKKATKIKEAPLPSTRSLRPKAKVTTVKEESEEEDEDDDSEADDSKKRKSGRVLKKKVVEGKKKGFAATKKAHESTEESQYEDEGESQDSSKKKKGGKKKAGTSKSKDQKVPNKFKKGVWNPLISKLSTKCLQKESDDNHIKNDCCVKCVNKEMIRAAQTKNHTLLKSLLETLGTLSTFNERWAPETCENFIEAVFHNKDKKALEMYLNTISDVNHKRFTNQPNCSLKEIDTGYNDQYAYGVRTRKVAVARGGREGNNAFVSDLGVEGDWSEKLFERLLEIDTDPHLFDLLRSSVNQIDNQLDHKIHHAVRAGNHKTAAHLITSAIKRGGWGFNNLHEQVLKAKNPKGLSEFKRTNTTKKNTMVNIVTPIHCAAINPNGEILKALLEVSKEYSITDEMMRKPVHYAAACEGPEPLQYLIKCNVDTREGDNKKTTPLMLACRYGRAHNVKILTESDTRSNLTAKNREGYCALHYAAQYGHLEALKILVEKGVDVKFPGPNRMTALHLAAGYGHYDCVKFLLDSGAKVLAKDKFKRSPLIMAVRNGNLKIASHLLQNGSAFNEPDSSKNHALHYAAAYGFPECIEELIKAGADINATNSWNLSPLTVAMQKNHFGCVKKLLSYPETDVNCKDDNGRTLISSSLDNLTEANFSHVKYLLTEKHADPNIPDLRGYNAFHYACGLTPVSITSKRSGFSLLSLDEQKTITLEAAILINKTVRLFIESGADLNRETSDNRNPFNIASSTKNYEIIDILLGQSELNLKKISLADTSIFHDLSHIIVESEGRKVFYQICEKLKSESALVNLVDSNGLTPIHHYFLAWGNTGNNAYQQILTKLQTEALELKKKRLAEENVDTIGNALDHLVLPKKSKEVRMKTMSVAKKAVEDDDGSEEDDEFPDEEEDDVLDENDDIDEEEDEEVPAFSFPGKAPRKQLAAFRQPIENPNSFKFGPPALSFPAQPFNFGANKYPLPLGKGLFGATPAPMNSFNFNNTNNPFGAKATNNLVTLSPAEIESITAEAVLNFKKHKEEMIELLKYFINYMGADPTRLVEKLKKYRNSNIMEIEEKSEVLPAIAQVARKAPTKPTRGLRFNNYTNTFTPVVETQKTDRKTPYGEHGLKNAYHMVVGFPSLDILQFIQNFKEIDLNQKNEISRTPFFLLCKNSHLFSSSQKHINIKESLDFFLSNGADPSICDELEDYPVINLALSQNFEFLKEIIERTKATLNVRNKNGVVPLIHWVNERNLACVEKLLEMGADPNFTDKLNRNSLHHAVNKANANADASFELESVLLNFKANVNAVDNRGRTPLHYSFVKIGQHKEKTAIDPIETVSSLMGTEGIMVNIQDKWGRTPLHYAAQRGSVISTLYLLNGKAELEIKDSDGNTALGVAILNDHSNVAINLIQNGACVTNRAYVVKKDDKKLDDEEETFESNPYSQNIAFAYNRYNPWNNQQQTAVVNIPEGDHSFFRVAIIKGWQGVAYLLLQHKYNIMKAIEDALNESKFQLVLTLLSKTSDNNLIQSLNDQGQNLLHVFAIKGNQAPQDLTNKIFEAFSRRGVCSGVIDKYGRLPFHYACEKQFYFLVEKFLDQKHLDSNLMDNENRSPFTIYIESSYFNTLMIGKFILRGANLNKKFKTKIGQIEYFITPLIYVILKFHSKSDIPTLLWYVQNGADINESDDHGRTPLIYAIIQNSKKIVKFLLSQPSTNPNKLSDNEGKSLIHYAVNPLEYGSYENIKMLKIICEKYKDLIDIPDKHGKTPLHYARLQDSGNMAEALRLLGAKEIKEGGIRRVGTSIISTIRWPNEEIDFEDHAEEFIKQCQEAKDKEVQNNKENIVQPDTNATSVGQVEVVHDDKHKPYDLLMTKVDIKQGMWSENVFYRMQVLHEKNRDVYILFTRWGRIGTNGQFQQTPFGTKEECVKEFCKIFSDKSGNQWEDRDSFQKKPKKYQLMKTDRQVNHKEYLVPFNLKDQKIPEPQLHNVIYQFMRELTQVRMLYDEMDTFGVDREFLPLSSLSKTQLMEAKHILYEINDLIQSEQALRKDKNLSTKVEKLLTIKEDIANKSSRYYELVPASGYKTEAIPPIDNMNLLSNKFSEISSLIDIEVSTKILLGAHLNIYKVHPLDYTFNSLNIRMMPLEKQHPEYLLIQKYASNSHNFKSGFINNIFAIERKGEAERMERWKNQPNKMILWHGSKTCNFLGIISLGLQVAPPGVAITGHAFGKGTYFADVFEKSWGYTSAYNPFDDGTEEKHKSYCYMLLCEVALGEMMELTNFQFISDLKDPYKSIKGLGSRGPNFKQNVVLQNGAVMPVGPLIEYEKDLQVKTRYLSHSEYIVFDPSQIRIRYILQLDPTQY